MAHVLPEVAVPNLTIRRLFRRTGLRVAAGAVVIVLVAATSGTVLREEERANFCRAEPPPDIAGDQVGPMGIAPPPLPPVLQDIAQHVHPVLGTDSSHDLPNAAKSHDAELDREAAEGMGTTPAPTGTSGSSQQASADMDESIAAARRRLFYDAGAQPVVGFGPRRR